MTSRERFEEWKPKKDISGQKFGRWSVLSFSGQDKRGNAEWMCRCECGAERIVSGYRLTAGKSKSCGCFHKDGCAARWTIHGGVSDPEYNVWRGFIQRCTNPKQPGYRNYGARGITVAESWMKYENFIADMGKRPSPKHSIDRIDNDAGYGPENCRWATKAEQLLNRRITVLYEFNGDKKTLIDWSRKTGLSVGALRGRIDRGWPISEALTKPAVHSRSY